MILVDTSIWIDHLHQTDELLSGALTQALVFGHPMIIGELACGSIRNRESVLDLLAQLPKAVEAEHAEVLGLIESRALHGRGLSLVDAHLLASATLTPDARLWTRDKRLAAAAENLGLAYV